MPAPPMPDAQLAGSKVSELLHALLHAIAGPNGQIHRIAGLLERHRTDLDEDARSWLSHLATATEHLDECLSALRRYAEIFDLPHDWTRFSLSDAVSSAVGSLRTQCTITVDSLPHVDADAKRMQLVLRELLENACKFFNGQAPPVRISAAMVGDSLVISITDTGLGIEAAQTERIFKPFVQLWGDRFPGMGMGLAIARTVVENWGGRIWVESVVGSGSTFRFTLPLRQAAS